MSTRNSAKWATLVSRWRRSGQTAEVFAAERGIKVSTLRWWSWALGKRRRSRNDEPPAAAERASTDSPIPAFLPVHVVSRDASSAHLSPRAGTPPVEIVVDDRLTLRVGAGFDEDTLIRVLDVLRRTQVT